MALLFSSFPFLTALRFALFYLVKAVLQPQASINYSQTGEDAVIRSILDEHGRGVYVDVGCNDPIRYSNTLSLYLHGWSGINIDANPRLIEKFKAVRVRDVAVCAAISDVEGEAVFHEFEDDLVSTLDTEILAEWQGKWKKRGQRVLQTRTLNSVLHEHLAPDAQIDLLSVDVEGHDLHILRSIDLDVFRPKLIVVELHRQDLYQLLNSDVTRYLDGAGYRQIGYDTLNGYFADTRGIRAGLRLP